MKYLNSFKCLFFTISCFILASFLTIHAGESIEKDFFSPETVQNYHNNSKLQWDLAMEALSNHPFVGDEKILDVGCGDGKITAYMAGLVPKGAVVGLDISNNMIEFATKNYPRDQYSNMCFVIGDGRNLPYEEDYDLIVSFCSLHWIPDQLDALHGMFQSLRTGGSLLVMVPAAPNGNDLFSVIRDLITSDKWKSLFKTPPHYSTAKEYKEMLYNSGFFSSEVTPKKVTTVFNNTQELKNGFVSSIASFKKLSKKQKKQLLQDYVDAVVSNFPPDEEGKIHVTSSCFEITAQKIPFDVNVDD